MVQCTICLTITTFPYYWVYSLHLLLPQTLKLLKTNAKQLAEPLSKFVQASIDRGKIPDDWKEALVTPCSKREIRVHTQTTAQCH